MFEQLFSSVLQQRRKNPQDTVYTVSRALWREQRGRELWEQEILFHRRLSLPHAKFQLWFKTQQLLFEIVFPSTQLFPSDPLFLLENSCSLLSIRRKTPGRCGKELGSRHLLMPNASDQPTFIPRDCCCSISCAWAPAPVAALWQRPNASAAKRGCLGTSG